MKYNTKDMKACCNEINAITTSISSSLKSIKTCVLCISAYEYWKGEAADYYVENFNHVIDSFGTVDNALKEGINYLNTVIADFDSLEVGLMDQLKNLVHSIGGK